ncbi:MAG: hypothetical protein AAF205_04275 [Pseudomonadota bacterium]
MNVISFESHARRHLTQRAARAERASAALAHYVAGEHGLRSAVEQASLPLMTATRLPQIVGTVVADWPRTLGVDTAALALAAHDEGMRASTSGVARIAAKRIRAWHDNAPGVTIRRVDGAESLFGEAGHDVDIVAILPLALPEPLGCGVLALGDRHGNAVLADRDLDGDVDVAETLGFLSGVLSRRIAACMMQTF